jgi:hypothetical protein
LFGFKIYLCKKKELIQDFKISLGPSGLDRYSSRYGVGGISVNSKSFSGSWVISKVFGGSSVICRTFLTGFVIGP